jgi:hypothetical protein
MWIKKDNIVVNLDLTSSFSCGDIDDRDENEVYFYFDNDKTTIILDHITGEKFVEYLINLIISNEDKKIRVLVENEELEKLIDGKFPTLHEFNGDESNEN